MLAAAAAVIASSGLAPMAAYADGPVTDLYVADIGVCQDSGPGTQATPFCSIQAAADAVRAGQTVHIAAGTYTGQVTLTHSGTPSAPISFVGQPAADAGHATSLLRPTSTTQAGVTVSGAHDIRISGLAIVTAPADGIDVLGSSAITLDMNEVSRTTTTSATSAGYLVDGASSDVAITRSASIVSKGYSVHVAAGAKQVTVASNFLRTDAAGGIHATGVSGLTVTGNSILNIPCAATLAIDGGSTGTVENNAFWSAPPTGTPPCAPAPLVSVAADSTATVTTAYNSFFVPAPRFAYAWGGTDYPTAAALAAAVPGQAAHDLDYSGTPAGNTAPPEGSPLLDSADAHAPGVTALDYFGKPRSADDPNSANTGTGAGTMDRGAFERQSVLTLGATFSPSSAAGAAPYDFSVSAAPTDSWGEAVGTRVDFGDGDGPQPVSGGTVAHEYAVPGSYTVTATATNTDGQTATSTQPVTVASTSAPRLAFTAAPLTFDDQPTDIDPDGAAFTLSAGADDWELRGGTLAFGDGDSTGISTGAPIEHSYAHPGTYTATVTTTDVIGRTSTATATLTVGDEILPLPPVRSYDSRQGGIDKIPANATVKLSLAQLKADFAGVHGVELTATVTNPKAAGSLVVYPDGTTRPGVSRLVFPAGHTVPNLMLAEAGANGVIDFYNSGAGPIDLLVDTLGIETDGQIGDTYSPAGPTRVLDTRDGTGAPKAPVAASGSLTLPIAGHYGVPSDAEAVLLNVITTNEKAAGHLTAYAHGTSNPGTSSSNWGVGQTVSNLVYVQLVDGSAVLDNASAGTVDFVADLAGYYHHYGTASVVVPTSQTRVLNTLNGTGTGGKIAKLGAKESLTLKVTGLDGVPATGASAADLNVLAITPAVNGYLAVFPDTTPRPTASTLNYLATRTTANEAVVPLGADGTIEVYNGGSSPVDVAIDLSGYYYSYAG